MNTQLSFALVTVFLCLLLSTTANAKLQKFSNENQQHDGQQSFNCKKTYFPDNCEFFLDGIALTYVQYSSFYQKTVLTQFVVSKPATLPPDAQPLLAANYLVKNSTSNDTFEVMSPMADYLPRSDAWVWQTSFMYQQLLPSVGLTLDYEVLGFNFVLQRPWADPDTCFVLTNDGGRFTLDNTFTPPTYQQWNGREELIWANQKGDAFNQKNACTK